MIPANISRAHVLRALRRIDREGVPAGRAGTKYVLEYKGRRYPPKLTVSIANEYANGCRLASSVFSGGKETNTFLHQLGFRTGPVRNANVRRPATRPSGHGQGQGETHTGQRCRTCKVRLRELLEVAYSTVVVGHSLGLGARLEDYRGTHSYADLEAIHSALVAHRGFGQLTRTARLPACDYFVERPGFIVEFDESQHYTAARAIALRRYPGTLALGFDRRRWQGLCTSIHARDNPSAIPG